eukprot:TRINITY_DN20968_c0_g1_i2.p2 TRINITY_DN20968_c0_g1~~TRINITY_DN20968_c0_g1_i2.p2  ORF type:complete len:186 (-),score=25.51 TRINITY_DN20968_c0_g1_i2:38-595(-)
MRMDHSAAILAAVSSNVLATVLHAISLQKGSENHCKKNQLLPNRSTATPVVVPFGDVETVWGATSLQKENESCCSLGRAQHKTKQTKIYHLPRRERLRRRKPLLSVLRQQPKQQQKSTALPTHHHWIVLCAWTTNGSFCLCPASICAVVSSAPRHCLFVQCAAKPLIAAALYSFKPTRQGSGYNH